MVNIAYPECTTFKVASKYFDEQFVNDNADIIDWKTVCSLIYLPDLSDVFFEKFKTEIDWGGISQNPTINLEFINKFQDNIDFKYLSTRSDLDMEIYLQFSSKIQFSIEVWTRIKQLPEDIIEKHADRLVGIMTKMWHRFSEPFLRKFSDKIHWYIVSSQNLSDSFLEEFIDKIEWGVASQEQKMSEQTIRKFKDNVNWCIISKRQILSENFISEFKNKVDWYNIITYQNLSIEFINEHKDFIFNSMFKFAIKNKEFEREDIVGNIKSEFLKFPLIKTTE